MAIRVLTLEGTSPRGFGGQHGAACRDDIHALYAIRLRLMLERTDLGDERHVLALAHHHLPILQTFSPALLEELEGIAEGSGLSPEQLVLLNHYTDLRDLGLNDLRALEGGGDPGGCSALFVDDPATGARVLGQTWDMHGSATPYALVLRVPGGPGGPGTAGETVVFTVTGCLGMTGMTSWGTALTINNLNSLDATLGVVWPALVRGALQERNARAMLALAQQSPIGSGRHYIFADGEEIFGMETSGTKKKIIFQGERERLPYVHTNHCIDEEMKPTARILPTSTTLQRFATLTALAPAGRAPRDAAGVYAALAEVSMPFNPQSPDDTATCGALVMDLGARRVLACQGLPDATRAPELVIDLGTGVEA
jgi:isopenicillin-N N-acyltransferase-like protein